MRRNLLIEISVFLSLVSISPATDTEGETDVSLLPGSWMSVAEAINSPQFVFAGVCEAVDKAPAEVSDAGVAGGRQKFKVLELWAGKRPSSGEANMQYQYYDTPSLREQPIKKGERVLWIAHFQKSVGYNGAKALADTPENRTEVLLTIRATKEMFEPWQIRGAILRLIALHPETLPDELDKAISDVDNEPQLVLPLFTMLRQQFHDFPDVVIDVAQEHTSSGTAWVRLCAELTMAETLWHTKGDPSCLIHFDRAIGAHEGISTVISKISVAHHGTVDDIYRQKIWACLDFGQREKVRETALRGAAHFLGTDRFNYAIDQLWVYCVTEVLRPADTEFGLAICDAYFQRPLHHGYGDLTRNRAAMLRARRLLTQAGTDPMLKDLIEAADIVVVGHDAGGGPGKREDLHKLLSLFDYNALLPRHASHSVYLSVKQVLKGNLDNPDALRFYRLSDLTLATTRIDEYTGIYDGAERVWILNRLHDSDILWASEMASCQSVNNIDLIRELIAEATIHPKEPAPHEPCLTANIPEDVEIEDLREFVAGYGLCAVPFLRNELANGSPDEKYEVIRIFSDYGVVPLIPDVIQAIADTSTIPPRRDMLIGTVGFQAGRALGGYAVLLDGIDLKTRGYDMYSLRDAWRHDEDLKRTVETVQANWKQWWHSYKLSPEVEGEQLLPGWRVSSP